MRTNVFLRSTRRQPVRTALLLLVIALVTFTFVGRASEYLLIEQETTRLAEYYRPVGVLTAAREDASEMAAVLLADPDVRLVEQRRYISAVMEEGCFNADTSLSTSFTNSLDAIFYGTLTRSTSAGLCFDVDTVLAGRPEYIQAGGQIRLWDEQAAAEACENMEAGRRYLVRGGSLNRALDGTVNGVLVRLSGSSGPQYLEAPEGREPDLSAPELEDIRLEIEKISNNQRTLNIIPTQDMKALPETQEASPSIYLTAGRWLDERDNAGENRSCVVHYALAKARGWTVGDTIRLRLRDVESDFGYTKARLKDAVPETAEEAYEIVGIYDFMSSYDYTFVRNNVYIPASAVPEGFVCGLEATALQNRFISTLNKAAGGCFPAAGELSFQLAGLDREKDFLEKYSALLEEQNSTLTILPNNCGNFTAVVEPMRRASLFNMQVYTLVLLAALFLIDFIYFRARGKEMAVVRAMGLPVKQCVWEGTLPLVLIAVCGVLAGGALGWQSTMHSAVQTLSALAGLDTSGRAAALSPVCLVFLWAAILTLILLLTMASALFLAKKPVLGQLQGGAQVKPKTPPLRPGGTAPEAACLRLEAVRAVRTAIPAERRPGRRAGVVFRFVRRQIVRAPVKTFLAAVLAATFTMGLGVIHLAVERNEQQIDWLFENTVVRMEILPVSDASRSKSGGFLYGKTVQAVVDTGLISEAYLEGAVSGTVITDIDLWNGGNPICLNLEEARKDGKAVSTGSVFRSFTGLEEFLSENGSGSGMTIEYFDGWDETLFDQDWTESAAARGESTAIPVIIPAEWSARCKGGSATLYPVEDAIILSVHGRLYLCTVAGVCTGGESSVLVPDSALRAISGGRMLYNKSEFAVDPSQNRDLTGVQKFIEEIANTPLLGNVPVHIAVWDRELTEAVAPLEESLELMRILYPVVFVLSLLTAAGTAALFVMMSAKDAATLRVLGTPRGRTQVILVLQQAVTCFSGLAIGVIGVLLYVHQARPELLEALAGAALWRGTAYLGAAVLGAVVCSAAVTNKNPLEMLQVKE